MEDKIYSYLDKIKFDKNLLKGLLPKYITNFRIVSLLFLAIVLTGITSFYNLPRRLNPKIEIPIIIVQTALPGGNPEDVESLVTIPLEDEISSIKDITNLTSTSSSGVSTIVIELSEDIDIDKARNDVREAVDNASADLPNDATTPRVQALDFEDQPVITFSLTSNQNVADLITIAKDLELELEKEPNLDRVSVSGIEEQEIQVVVTPENLSKYSLNIQEVASLIKNALDAYPSGLVQTDSNRFAIGIDRAVNNIEDIRNLQIKTNNNTYKLSDVADIKEASKVDQPSAYYAKHDQDILPSVNFTLYKTINSEIDESGRQFRATIDNFANKYKDRVQISINEDYSEEIDDQFRELGINFRDTIVLVFIVLFVFLGIRQAFIASITIPLTILNTFFIMQIINIDLSFISLFAMILALGLVVDDAIVIISATTNYYKSGHFSPIETGLLVWRDFIMPIWATTITTIWSFVPLLLASGIIGEFIKPIPLVVTAAMLSSTSIAVFLTLPLMVTILKYQMPTRLKVFLGVLVLTGITAASYYLLPKNNTVILIATLVSIVLLQVVTFKIRAEIIEKAKKLYSDSFSERSHNRIKLIFSKGLIDLEVISLRYQKTLLRVLNSKLRIRQVIIAITIFTLFSYILVPLGYVRNEFFPPSDSELMFFNLELPNGTHTDITTKETKAFINELKTLEEIEFITASIGSSRDSNNEFTNGSHLSNITLNLLPEEEREKTSVEMVNELSNKYKFYENGKITVSSPAGGPPVGADISISILGEDLSRLDSYAGNIISYLNQEESILSAEKNIKQGTSKIVFVPDLYKLSEKEVLVAEIAGTLRNYISGQDVDTIKTGPTDDIDITFRVDNKLLTPKDLSQINVSKNGEQIPLGELGSFTLKPNPTQINREDRKRLITVNAQVRQGFAIPEVNTKVENYIDNDLNLEAGYERKTGGVNEENERSVQSILQAMVLSGILILITMVLMFSSYRQAAIVMSVIPLAISGVFIVFALTYTPLSFPSLIGLLALFGIVVTHSMVMVDKINANIKIGVDLKNAIAEGSSSRLEPVLLTTLTSIAGLIPISLSDPIWQGLGGAIIAGLAFSGLIMLLFIPVVYYLAYKGSQKAQ